jgi:hypothetical protein
MQVFIDKDFQLHCHALAAVRIECAYMLSLCLVKYWQIKLPNHGCFGGFIALSYDELLHPSSSFQEGKHNGRDLLYLQ